MTLTILDGILVLVPNCEGVVYIDHSDFKEVHKILTENKGFRYRQDSHGDYVFTRNEFEDWIVVTDIKDTEQVSVAWGHW